MTRSKALYIALLSGMACCLGACKEQAALKAEIAAEKVRVEELWQEHDKIAEEAKSYQAGRNALQNLPAVRRGEHALETSVKALETSIQDLEQRKQALGADIEALRKDFTEYKSKNL